jgi:uncharacterized protein YyaL (SSP411 family)
VAAFNALKLAYLTGADDLREKAERTLARYGPRIGVAGRQVPMMMCVLSAWHAGFSQIAIVGSHSSLHEELARHYLPFALVIPVVPGQNQDAIGRLLPFTAAMTTRGAEAAAYVCREFTCAEPVTSAEDLARQIAPDAESRRLHDVRH